MRESLHLGDVRQLLLLAVNDASKPCHLELEGSNSRLVCRIDPFPDSVGLLWLAGLCTAGDRWVVVFVHRDKVLEQHQLPLYKAHSLLSVLTHGVPNRNHASAQSRYDRKKAA